MREEKVKITRSSVRRLQPQLRRKVKQMFRDDPSLASIEVKKRYLDKI